MPRPTTLLAAAALTLAGTAYGLTAPSMASAATAKVTTAHSSITLPTIVIGSENFPESILGNLYADVLQNAGFRTSLRSDLGTRQYVENALAHKALDLFPDYAGSLLVFLKRADTVQAGQLSTDVPALKGALAPVGATVLNPAPALDTNVFAVTKATAAKYHLKTLSDLTAVASQLAFAAPPECPQNYFCLPGLEKVYGLHFKTVISADDAGPITVADLSNGKAQVAELFSTDGAIASNGFVQLQDNRHLEPADHIIPVIRTSFDTPAVAKALDALSAKLTQQQLDDLDNTVNTNHDPASTASSWLKAEGLG